MRLFPLLRELNDYTPKDSMVTSAEEMNYIAQTLCFPSATVDDLHNMRDLCVSVWDCRITEARYQERCGETPDCDWLALSRAMQSITAVIDNELCKRGSII